MPNKNLRGPEKIQDGNPDEFLVFPGIGFIVWLCRDADRKTLQDSIASAEDIRELAVHLFDAAFQFGNFLS